MIRSMIPVFMALLAVALVVPIHEAEAGKAKVIKQGVEAAKKHYPTLKEKANGAYSKTKQKAKGAYAKTKKGASKLKEAAKSKALEHAPKTHNTLRNYKPSGTVSAGKTIVDKQRNRRCSGNSGNAGTTPQYCR